jgi:hypothetical protein
MGTFDFYCILVKIGGGLTNKDDHAGWVLEPKPITNKTKELKGCLVS